MSPSSPRPIPPLRGARLAGLLASLLFSFAFFGLLAGCEESGTSSYDVPTWSFSGVVLDGAADGVLPGASIEYVDADGIRRVLGADSAGGFRAEGVPYGQTVFRFGCSRRVSRDSVVRYGERVLTASSYNESSAMTGALAGGVRVVRLFPLSGAFSGTLVVRVAGSSATVPARGVALRLVYRDTAFVSADPSVFSATTDSVGAFRFSRLPADSGLQLSVPRFVQDGRSYESDLVAVPMLRTGSVLSLGRIVASSDTVADYVEPVASSNVLDASGLGLVGIRRGGVPWFRIAHDFDSLHVDARLLDGTAAVAVSPRVHGDTIFLEHADLLPADALLSTEITGLDGRGMRFHVLLDGLRRFRTTRALAAVESNLWSTSTSYRARSGLGDTLWVRFSEPLSNDPDGIDWLGSGVERTVYGGGATPNARSWTKAETLFVVPDARMDVDTTGSMGFSVVVRAVDGERSDTVDVSTPIEDAGYAIRWSNAINALGEFRDDLGSTDSIVVVADRPVAALLRAVAADAGTLPSGLQPSDVTLRGRDTIVYRPTSTLAPGVVYGMAFDLRGTDGVVRRKALQVRWKTEYRTSIVFASNRDGSEYRRFRSLGDSLVVRFSQPIDTAKPFVVRMKDVRGSTVQTRVRWNAALDQATIFNVSPFPLANHGISSTLGAGSDSAKAVADVSFDLQSKTGERIVGLRVAYDSLRLYSEAGLCAVSANFLKAHVDGYEVVSTESVVDSFPVAGTIRVGFSRALDTAWIRRQGDSTFVSLQTSSGPVVPSSLRFEDGGKILVVDPRDPLVAGTSYYLQFIKIPARDVRDASAIARHGGVYGGTTSTGFLVGTPFTAR